MEEGWERGVGQVCGPVFVRLAVRCGAVRWWMIRSTGDSPPARHIGIQNVDMEELAESVGSGDTKSALRYLYKRRNDEDAFSRLGMYQQVGAPLVTFSEREVAEARGRGDDDFGASEFDDGDDGSGAIAGRSGYRLGGRRSPPSHAHGGDRLNERADSHFAASSEDLYSDRFVGGDGASVQGFHGWGSMGGEERGASGSAYRAAARAPAGTGGNHGTSWNDLPVAHEAANQGSGLSHGAKLSADPFQNVGSSLRPRKAHTAASAASAASPTAAPSPSFTSYMSGVGVGAGAGAGSGSGMSASAHSTSMPPLLNSYNAYHPVSSSASVDSPSLSTSSSSRLRKRVGGLPPPSDDWLPDEEQPMDGSQGRY